jgi:hypothetical protein
MKLATSGSRGVFSGPTLAGSRRRRSAMERAAGVTGGYAGSATMVTFTVLWRSQKPGSARGRTLPC